MTFFRSIIIYAFAMAVLIGLLKFAEYQFFVRDHRVELYIGFVAVFFIGLGIWVGTRLTSVKDKVKSEETEGSFVPDEDALKRSGVTKREFEVLALIAEGLSNQEIADRLFVSRSTVKSHTSNLFFKLGASRRTQALQKAKEMGVLT